MSDSHTEYWIECVESALEEHGVTASKDQVIAVAADVEVSHDNYGLAFYSPASDPRNSEIEQLREELAIERSKVSCSRCGGSGRITTQGPYHSSNSDCMTCDGYGKTLPI